MAASVGNRSYGAGQASSRTLSAHSPSAGADELYVGVGFYDALVETLDSITWRGVATGITDLGGITNNNRRVEVWRIETPGSGAGDLVATFSNVTDHGVELIDAEGVVGYRAASLGTNAANNTTVQATADPSSASNGGDLCYGVAEFKRGGAYNLEASSGTELTDDEVSTTSAKLFLNTQWQLATGATETMTWTVAGTGGNTHAELAIAIEAAAAVAAMPAMRALLGVGA